MNIIFIASDDILSTLERVNLALNTTEESILGHRMSMNRTTHSLEEIADKRKTIAEVFVRSLAMGKKD